MAYLVCAASIVQLYWSIDFDILWCRRMRILSCSTPFPGRMEPLVSWYRLRSRSYPLSSMFVWNTSQCIALMTSLTCLPSVLRRPKRMSLLKVWCILRMKLLSWQDSWQTKLNQPRWVSSQPFLIQTFPPRASQSPNCGLHPDCRPCQSGLPGTESPIPSFFSIRKIQNFESVKEF